MVIDRWDFSEAKTAITKQLCYFPTAFIQIEGDNFDYSNAKIFQNDLFSWSEIYPSSEMHINFGGVHYPIDWDILKIPKLTIPIGIKIAPDKGINPFFNRESLEYNALCKQTIKDTISKIADYFVEKYNEQQKDEYELLEVFNKITDSNKYVSLGNEEFRINDLLQYTTIKPKELKIKGVNVMKPEFYYNLKSTYLDEYETLVDYNRGKWSIKHVKHNHGCNEILNNIKHIEVDKVPTGLVKKFLLEKYTDSRVLFVKKVNTRRLGNIKFSLHNSNKLNYTYILDLEWNDKQNWRSKIQEFQFVKNKFKSLIINELNVENSNEYLNWLAKYKEEQKNNRKLGIYRGNHKVLNKQQGDVTLGIIEEKEIGTGYKINKKVFKIETFHRIPKLHVIFKEENKERAKLFAGLFGVNKFKFATIGKNEYLKVKNMHNIKTEEEFIKCKAFRKVATSILFEDLIKEYDKMFDKEAENIISQLIKPLENDVNILKNYINKNVKRIKDNELLEALLETAKEFNLYDFEFWDVYLRVKEGVKKYDFLSLIEEPRRWNQEEKRKTQSLINQIIYHRKMYHNQFEELEITVKQPEVTKVEEETILEEQLETV